jgi:UDP-GlcNAc:undecaprenyl-phosphate GlcNAc-1-phosphate transferase
MRRLALAFGAVARPNPIVRSHRKPVPYFGGLAVVLVWLVLLAGSSALAGHPIARDTMARMASALALVVFGAWDDLHAFGPGVKFAIQLVICSGYLGVVGPLDLGSRIFQLLVLLSLINAFNFIDVMDGLLCAVTAVAVGGLLIAPNLMPMTTRRELEYLLAGLGTLFIFNAPPARVFSGDAGSMTLGFLVGAWLLTVGSTVAPNVALSLAGVCALPALELALLIPARLRRGLSPFRGSPDHFALRLQDQLGWSKWRVLAMSSACAALFALAPWFALVLTRRWATCVAVVFVLSGAALWYGLWRIPPATRVERTAHEADAVDT